MKTRRLFASALALAMLAPAPALAQMAQPAMEVAPGNTLLTVTAEGKSFREPDMAVFSAGVTTQGDSAAAALAENSRAMTQVIAALKRAGIAERDIQTSNLNLNPNYRHAENQPPQLIGYQAVNQVNVRFRDIAKTGAILDALVAQGANQINGPTLTIDRPETALDEARTNALEKARARAELYARSLGMRVARILSVSESGGFMPPPRPMMERAMAGNDASTQIVPGEQTLTVALTVSFELQ